MGIGCQISPIKLRTQIMGCRPPCFINNGVSLSNVKDKIRLYFSSILYIDRIDNICICAGELLRVILNRGFT